MTSRSKGKTWANDDTGVLKGGKDENADDKVKIAADSDDDLYEDLPAMKPKDGGDDDDDDGSDDEHLENGVSMDQRSRGGESNKSTHDSDAMDVDNEPRNKTEQDKDAAIAQIEDTGRLFVRNLTYTCTEADLKELFSAYGPLSEVSWMKQ